MSEHDGQGGRKYTALYVGVVVDNADPLKLGRVRVKVQGLVEKSNWAFPLGTFGGGTKQRGGFRPPKKGADVGVMFNAGDVDAPYYLCGHWGEGEAPDYLTTEDVAPEDADKVMVWEGDRYEVVADERPGKERFRIRDKKSNDEILMDGLKRGINIKGTSLVHIESTGGVVVDGASVTICDRPVIRNGKPIA